MKKFLSVLLALAMIFSLTVTVSADETKGEMDGYVVVLHTNDVHGAISGYAKVAALKKAYEAEGAYVLLMDAGDFCQGDPTVSVSQGKTAVELMNMAGYDVTTLGNHEFDYGYDNLVNLSKEAKFPIVAANVLYQGKVAFNANQIFTTPSGVKIGVFGLETPETATKAHPAKIKGVTILGDKSMFDCAQAQVDSLKADGCDYIICLGHLGIDKESLGNRSTDLLNVVDGIDVFIDGHSHSTMKDIAEVTDKDGKDIAYTAEQKDGVLTVIRDNSLQKEPTVGQVPLVSGEIAEDLTSYYAYSEQVPTVMALGVLVDKDLTILCAGGFMVQLLPGATDAEIDMLEKNIAAMPSVTTMLHEGKTPEDMMQMALAGFEPNVLDERDVHYQCDCSAERTKEMLFSLGRKELVKMRDEDPNCEVVCHFCHSKYQYDLNDLIAEYDAQKQE